MTKSIFENICNLQKTWNINKTNEYILSSGFCLVLFITPLYAWSFQSQETKNCFSGIAKFIYLSQSIILQGKILKPQHFFIQKLRNTFHNLENSLHISGLWNQEHFSNYASWPPPPLLGDFLNTAWSRHLPHPHVGRDWPRQTVCQQHPASTCGTEGEKRWLNMTVSLIGFELNEAWWYQNKFDRESVHAFLGVK